MKAWATVPTRALIKRYQRTAGVDKARASAVCTAYKQFLALKVVARDHDDELLAAPAPVNAMWTQHVLDTASYAEHMRTLCGQMLHHSPRTRGPSLSPYMHMMWLFLHPLGPGPAAGRMTFA